MLRRPIFALLALLAGCASSVRPVYDASTVGGPDSDKNAEIYMPAGNGPFPGMVVLHGCDGVGQHYRDWVRRLAGWGYATILPDSFRPRGVTNVCNMGSIVPARERAADAFAAAAYLRTLPAVRGDRIGVIGFSHGGSGVMQAVLSDTVAADHATPFTAAVAFYPGCGKPRSPLATDTLILIGSDDDWVSADRCQEFSTAVDRGGHALLLTVYPGARHSFDAALPLHFYLGHYLGRNEAAFQAALVATQQFLGERLMPGAR